MWSPFKRRQHSPTPPTPPPPATPRGMTLIPTSDIERAHDAINATRIQMVEQQKQTTRLHEALHLLTNAATPFLPTPDPVTGRMHATDDQMRLRTIIHQAQKLLDQPQSDPS